MNLLLPQYWQCNIAFTKEEFIKSSTKNNIKFTLYRLYIFYVEVDYDDQDNK
ncbi:MULTISPECIES: hypothetical protein [Chryseobacterium]|uniref:hypothetical protein n=1 Tax=Chryseobacterium TaxID=59732 RepID=UPI0012F390BA|nr:MULTISPECIES: hypothetical protein [Chryseobacterium]MDQ0593402.1 hypothetical protein [Chryseobacterium ginsenosidimutans]VXC00193.1 conserved hypothetical protein [Chryseobacterium sp. 8AT]